MLYRRNTSTVLYIHDFPKHTHTTQVCVILHCITSIVFKKDKISIRKGFPPKLPLVVDVLGTTGIVATQAELKKSKYCDRLL